MIHKTIIGVLVLSCLCGCNGNCDSPTFVSHLDTPAKPWTHEQFKNDPADFQFAIVSDRNGGRRAGIFSQAMQRLNWLQPEFVMCVGDLISGGVTNLDVLNAEWAEVQDRTESLEMPFFYAVGNHDIGNEVMSDLWRQKFGANYYSFVYINTHRK